MGPGGDVYRAIGPQDVARIVAANLPVRDPADPLGYTALVETPDGACTEVGWEHRLAGWVLVETPVDPEAWRKP